MQLFKMRRPDDLHVHLRDGDALPVVLPHTAKQFARALVMPNLKPPVTTTAMALAYRSRIMAALPSDISFEALMSLYLTDNTPVEEVVKAKNAGIRAFKLYPAGATTNSDAGVTTMSKIAPVLAAMEREGLLLLVHGEVTDASIDIFDREAIFIDRVLEPLRRDFPALKVVFEHITTRQAAQYVAQASHNLAATITAHHLLYNRNALFKGGLQPHYYCLPVLKKEEHRLALIHAATSGDSRFFLGTDSAPHATRLKEQASGCAGCYTAFNALELYAKTFDDAGKLENLEAFASENGANFYNLPLNDGEVTLRKEDWLMPLNFSYGNTELTPLGSGETLAWRVLDH